MESSEDPWQNLSEATLAVYQGVGREEMAGEGLHVVVNQDTRSLRIKVEKEELLVWGGESCVLGVSR